jgi:hypothetical protein
MKKKLVPFFFLFSGFISLLPAQSVYVGGIFPTIDHSGSISRRLDYSLYYFGAFPLVNLNKPNISGNPNFLMFYSEQTLTYNANPNLSFSGSYVYQRENVTKASYVNENRLHFQASLKQDFGNNKLRHRLRFDNRFIQNRNTGKSPYTHRLRYLIGVDVPIKTPKNNLYFTAYEEGFFNTYENAPIIFGENWAYAALGVRFNKIHKIEVGPIYISWYTGNNSWFNQFYIQCSWISHLNLEKE